MEKQESELLKKFGSRRPFSVPDGYFDHLSERVMSRIDAEERQPAEADHGSADAAEEEKHVGAVKVSLWKRLRPMASAAAVVAILGFSAYLIFPSAGRQPAKVPSAVPAAMPTAAQQKAKEKASEADMDAFADYTMMDDDDMYAYLSEN